MTTTAEAPTPTFTLTAGDTEWHAYELRTAPHRFIGPRLEVDTYGIDGLTPQMRAERYGVNVRTVANDLAPTVTLATPATEPEVQS